MILLAATGRRNNDHCSLLPERLFRQLLDRASRSTTNPVCMRMSTQGRETADDVFLAGERAYGVGT
jgi:hypothetical protein